MREARKRLVLLGFLFAAAAAQPAFLDSLRKHPGWQAAKARLDAAQLADRLSPDWVELDASGGWSRRQLDQGDPCPFLNDPDPTNDVFCSFISPDLPDEAGQAQVGLTLRPIPFGDFADRQRQAALDREEAELDFRLARSRLEVEALRAALQVMEAEQGLELAMEGRRFAERALAATQLRVEKGAAGPRELRDANLALARAREQARNTEEQRKLARNALLAFTEEPPPAPPWFRTPLPGGEPPEVTRARLQLERARIGQVHSGRDLLPVLQIEYREHLDDQNLLGVLLESRTLGTRVYYDYTSYADPTRSRTESELRLGARLNLSVASWSQVEQARRLVDAAQSSLEATRKSAAIQVDRLKTVLAQRVRSVDLAVLALENARKTEQETARRLELGLSTPLEHLRSQLDRLAAAFELTRARNDVLRAQLDYLVYLGVPPSEVWR